MQNVPSHRAGFIPGMPFPARWVPFVFVSILVACSAQGSPKQSTTGAILTISSPANGAVVSTSTIEVEGSAPSGAEIVQDISLAADQRTSAGADGSWVLTVDLKKGENVLKFRIGSDTATTKTIRVTHDPDGGTQAPGSSTSDTEETSTETEPPATQVAAATATPTAKPTATPTPVRTPVPTPTPRPTPVARTFGDGDWIVGSDIQPGTYRLRETPLICYWERLKGFSGGLDDIIANGNGMGYAVITIGKSDAGFSSTGCGTWSSDLSAVTDSKTAPFEDGTYIVNVDIAPGTWRSSGGGDFCYAERLKGFGGTLGEIITNDVSQSSLVISIAKTDKGFSSSGCGSWTKIK
jgi:hypothetical protein